MPDNRKGLQFLGFFPACWALPVLSSSFPAVTVCVIPCRIQKEVSMCAWTRSWALGGSTSKGITGRQDSACTCTWNATWYRWDLGLPKELPQQLSCLLCSFGSCISDTDQALSDWNPHIQAWGWIWNPGAWIPTNPKASVLRCIKSPEVSDLKGSSFLTVTDVFHFSFLCITYTSSACYVNTLHS